MILSFLVTVSKQNLSKDLYRSQHRRWSLHQNLNHFESRIWLKDTRIIEDTVSLDSSPILAALQSRSAKCAGSFVTETAPTWHRPTVRVRLGDVVLGMITLRSTWHNVANQCQSMVSHNGESSGKVLTFIAQSARGYVMQVAPKLRTFRTFRTLLNLFSRQLCSDWFLGGRLSLRWKPFTSHDLGQLLPFARQNNIPL